MHRLYLLPAALMTMLAVSCAPSYHLSLKPAQSTNLFLDGREQARAFTADSLEVRLSFAYFEPSRMVFEAVYRNPTRQAVVVSPTEFTYCPSRIPGTVLRKAKVRPAPGDEVNATVVAASRYEALPPLPPHPIAAFDPEPEISTLLANAENEARRANRIDWFGVALAVTSVAVDVASVGKKETTAQVQSRAEMHDGVVAYQIASTATKVGHAIAAESLSQQAANLQDFALRKVTLEPGQQVRGLLYFPRFNSADVVQIFAPVPGGNLPLEFVQTHIRQ
jgi:hypothetical protein